MRGSSFVIISKQVALAARSAARHLPAAGSLGGQLRCTHGKRSDAAEVAKKAAKQVYKKEHINGKNRDERVEAVTVSAGKMAWETIPRVGTDEFEKAEEKTGLKEKPKKQHTAKN